MVEDAAPGGAARQGLLQRAVPRGQLALDLTMIYVDPLRDNGWKLRGHRTLNCHLFADSPEELHEFAARLGMKRAWFQDDRRLPHYDLTPARRQEAVRLGAMEMTRRETGEFMRVLQRKRTT
jgi:hypothetical protein